MTNLPKAVPSDLMRQTRGHGYDAGCECDLVGGDPECTIQPPYESLEDYIMRLILRVMEARANLALTRVALERITEQTDNPCQCENHDSPDCCRFAKDFCCPECIAQGALDEIDKDKPCSP